MNNLTTFEEFLNESSKIKEVVLSNEILNFLEERGVIAPDKSQKVHKDLTAFLKGKLNEGINENFLNEAARSNEALKYVTSKYKDQRVNSVTFDEILVPLANHLDDYADRMMGDLEYSKATFAAFKKLVDLMVIDHIESDKYN